MNYIEYFYIISDSGVYIEIVNFNNFYVVFSSVLNGLVVGVEGMLGDEIFYS